MVSVYTEFNQKYERDWYEKFFPQGEFLAFESEKIKGRRRT